MDSKIEKFKKDSSFTGQMLFFNKKDFDQLKINSFEHNHDDTARLIYFAPDSFMVHSFTKNKQVLTLLQNNYHGWEAFINDKPVDIYTGNKSLISVVVPAGKNSISFVYRNTGIRIAMWICIATMLFSIMYIGFSKKISKEKNQ